MTKVALLGDSIRLIGYGTQVPQKLGEAYTVWQPAENGRFSLYTLQALSLYSHDMEDVEIVHWNNGNWDVDDLYGDGPLTRPDVYVDTMLRIARVLKSRARRVIFATTTPVRKEYRFSDNERIARYNAMLTPRLMEMGVEINDLYALVLDSLEEYIRADDFIHLTQAGIDACADAVVRAIVCGGQRNSGGE